MYRACRSKDQTLKKIRILHFPEDVQLLFGSSTPPPPLQLEDRSLKPQPFPPHPPPPLAFFCPGSCGGEILERQVEGEGLHAALGGPDPHLGVLKVMLITLSSDFPSCPASLRRLSTLLMWDRWVLVAISISWWCWCRHMSLPWWIAARCQMMEAFSVPPLWG